MKRKLLFLLLTAVLFTTIACTAQAGAEPDAQANVDALLAQSDSANCPVTRAPTPRFVPPEPWPEYPPIAGQFWLGEPGLWTAVPGGGRWAQLAKGEKVWWWSEHFDVSEDDTPDLTVTARRLDQKAENLTLATEATNGYHQSFHWAMLVGVELPSAGCWEITGAYNKQTLSFVVWVPTENES